MSHDINESKENIDKAMCKLLRQFANPDYPALRNERLLNATVEPGTGVGYNLNIDPSDDGKFGLVLFMTIHKGHPKRELTKRVSLKFEMSKFHKDHREYVYGTVQQLMQVASDFLKHDEKWNGPMVASLDDPTRRLEYGAEY